MKGNSLARASSEIYYLTSPTSNSRNLDTRCDYFLIPKLHCCIIFAAGAIVKFTLKELCNNVVNSHERHAWFSKHVVATIFVVVVAARITE